MKFIVDGEQMKQIDKYTIEKIGIPSLVLMERAALFVVDTMLKTISRRDKILAVCGTGNNGGDGIAAARLLKEQGFDAAILILGDEKRASEQTKAQLMIARNLDVPVFNNVRVSEYNIIIDAIFGIGLCKTVEGIFHSMIEEINQADNRVFSVDIPSGIHAKSGKVLGAAVKADTTITFGWNKIGIILYPGCEYAGNVEIADIGFSKKAIKAVCPETFILEESDIHLLPDRVNYSNKGTYGRVLVIAGSKNMCGACYLSAKAAYRMGTGLVKILTVEDNRNIIQTTLPEAILSTYQPNELKSKLEVERIKKELEWATAIVIGPGMGVSSGAEQLIDIVLQNVTAPIVIDADALNIWAGKEKKMSLPANVILTPHLKEMSRILQCEVEDIREQMIETAVKAVENETFTLVLKDARTIIINGKHICINTSGNHGMATGGSGDVLTGIIVGLLAQGMEYFHASSLGVYIHGLAADYAVKEKSCYSLMASDIIEALPYVLNQKKDNSYRWELT